MIAILMSTYNGEAYLKPQLDSLLAQTVADFTLYIRDDGSTDGTCALIRSYSDPRIRFEQGENLGPAGSFFALLNRAAQADYLFFSDQDDVWHPDKLARMLEAARPHKGEPVMVFSDFEMMDGEGRITAPSYAAYAHLQVEPGEVPLAKILAQPYAFGCASVITGELAKRVQHPPEGIEMHDCWMALTAAAVGRLIYLPEATIAHRFHNANATGRSGQASLMARLRRITKGFSAQAENSALRLRQVRLLLQAHGPALKPEAEALLTRLARAMDRGRLPAVAALAKNKVSRQRALNTLFFYITVLFGKGGCL